MNNHPVRSIPRPLVKTNQSVIVGSVILSWITGQIWLLAIPLIAGLIGLISGTNPIMRFAKLFLTKPLSSYIPEDHEQQQFNQTIAVVLLALGLISFVIGWTAAGYILTGMVAMAASIALLGFCIGCFLHYQLKQFQYRRSLK